MWGAFIFGLCIGVIIGLLLGLGWAMVTVCKPLIPKPNKYEEDE